MNCSKQGLLAQRAWPCCCQEIKTAFGKHLCSGLHKALGWAHQSLNVLYNDPQLPRMSAGNPDYQCRGNRPASLASCSKPTPSSQLTSLTSSITFLLCGSMLQQPEHVLGFLISLPLLKMSLPLPHSVPSLPTFQICILDVLVFPFCFRILLEFLNEGVMSFISVGNF